MLTRIQLENFRCFSEAVDIRLCREAETENPAESSKEHKEAEGRITPAAVLAVYGPAASGKTSLLAGIRDAWQQCDPWMEEKAKLLEPVDRFQLSEETKYLPCKFALTFTKDGREETALSFSITEGGVVEETLESIRGEEKTLRYHRIGDFLKDEHGKRMNGDAIQRLQEEMKENPEYLTAWLLQRLKFGLWTEDLSDLSCGLTCIGHGYTDSLEEELLIPEGGRAALHAVHWIVKKTQPGDIDLALDPLNPDLPEAYTKTLSMSLTGLKVVHSVPDGKGGVIPYHLDLDQESDSLLAWMAMAPRLVRALKKGSVVLMDDIERTFPLGEAEKLLQLFADPKTNPGGAQLVFTTADDRYLALSQLPGFSVACLGRDNSAGSAKLQIGSMQSPEPNPLKRLQSSEQA